MVAIGNLFQANVDEHDALSDLVEVLSQVSTISLASHYLVYHRLGDIQNLGDLRVARDVSCNRFGPEIDAC